MSVPESRGLQDYTDSIHGDLGAFGAGAGKMLDPVVNHGAQGLQHFDPRIAKMLSGSRRAYTYQRCYMLFYIPAGAGFHILSALFCYGFFFHIGCPLK
jgi:hypothetical protein